MLVLPLTYSHFLIGEPNVKPNINMLISKTLHTCMHTVMGRYYVTVGSVYKRQKAPWTVLSPLHII